MNYFVTDPAMTADLQLRNIDSAYRLAGLDAPGGTTATLEAIRDEPGPQQVAQQLAMDAYSATDPDAYLDDALTRIARAQAADILRQAVGRAFEGVAQRSLEATLAKAKTDLMPAFKVTVQALTKAAAKLDADNPLSVDSAVRDDSTQSLKQAQQALRQLGVFASIHNVDMRKNCPPQLALVLPILHLPECVEEIVTPSYTYAPPALNAAELDGTETVRRLATDLRLDVDNTLVKVARGEYRGVRFGLADRPEVRGRRAAADRAHTVRTVKPNEQIRHGAIVSG